MVSGFLELFLRVVFCLILAKPWGYPGITFAEMSAWIGAALLLGIYYHYTMHQISKRKEA